MKQILVLPTWLIYKAITPLLDKNHPWKGIKIGLKEWSLESTNLNNYYSLGFWLMPVVIFLIV
jgi:hypothetical protein